MVEETRVLIPIHVKSPPPLPPPPNGGKEGLGQEAHANALKMTQFKFDICKK